MSCFFGRFPFRGTLVASRVGELGVDWVEAPSELASSAIFPRSVAGHVGELGVVVQEGQADHTGGTGPVLGHQYLGGAPIG